MPSLLLSLIGMFLNFGKNIKDEELIFTGQVGFILQLSCAVPSLSLVPTVQLTIGYFSNATKFHRAMGTRLIAYS